MCDRKKNDAMVDSAKYLLVLGGTIVTKGSDGICRTKGTFAAYISSLAENYDSVLWVVPEGKGFKLNGKVNTDNITIISYRNSIHELTKAWDKILSFLKKQPDAIIFHSVLMLPVMPFIKAKARRMVCYLGLDYQEPIRQNILRKIPGWKWFYKKGYEYPLSKADVVLARGKRLAKICAKLNKNVIETMPMGWETQVTPSEQQSNRSDIPKNPWKILFIGKISKEKGVEQLILAAKKIVEKYGCDAIIFDLVGAGDSAEYWQEKAGVLLKKEVIKFHGWIDDPSKIKEFYQNAHVLVCPSIYPEGVPRVVDEALMRSVPVIASRLGGITAEFDDDQVYFVEPGSAEALAKAIAELIENQEIRKKFLLGAKRRTQHWGDFSTAAQQHLYILRS